MEILKQLQYNPYSVEKQVAIVYLGTNNLIREVPVKNVKAFEETFLQQMELKLPDVLAEFKKGNLPEDGLAKLKKLVTEFIPQFKK